jgi:hypothetical protein
MNAMCLGGVIYVHIENSRGQDRTLCLTTRSQAMDIHIKVFFGIMKYTEWQMLVTNVEIEHIIKAAYRNVMWNYWRQWVSILGSGEVWRYVLRQIGTIVQRVPISDKLNMFLGNAGTYTQRNIPEYKPAA